MPIDLSRGRAPDTSVPVVRPQVPLALDEQTLNCFLVTARCGCFMQAARRLNLKPVALRKRLAALEARLGYSLFVNRNNNPVLSQQGERLQQVLQAREPVVPPAREASASVRLAVAEPLLQDLLGRNLINFVRQHAGMRLEVATLDGRQVPEQAADVALWLGDLDQGAHRGCFADTTAEALATLEYLPHIAKRYAREANRPTSLAHLQDYMLVQWQGEVGVQALTPWQALLSTRSAGVTQIQDYEMYCQLIKCSASVGLLPHYAAHLDRGLLALPGLFREPMRRRVWLAVDERTEADPLVQVMVGAIRAAFEERREWFAGR
ncbi:LysR family transcriptional regulator [Pseudomonas soli]|uniref:DNA-binding transcriptional regulator, LysR family n=1 Tax=Pseudomonas soli TaxID=1306993 RepID=A0A1H9UC73_9PSED|nr:MULTISPECIES: LysR family transcriptional regulator [Pseudomonas]MDX2310639.1 LysR family transcriptional regulator [Pseudomonas sp. On1]NBK41701.1 LysR family transcriptional regulator [Pseudomonas soli]WJO19676.1 LysR family transcriptional regulator [Pseudomonas soli]SES06858.1 DNA-binding transcriptional regulator, LysR family [Pseudomonas soli]